MRNHICFDGENFELNLLDQRLLPQQEKVYTCRALQDVIYAIQNMVVRGAPAIGVAAAYGCVLAAREAGSGPDWRQELEKALRNLESARPTAVNLAWAVRRLRGLVPWENDSRQLAEIWLEEARRIQLEDENLCRAIGRHGADLLKSGDTVLTHCNAGALATAGYGTALGVIRAAVAQGKRISVIADETRPLLQGARLTAYELAAEGIPVKTACDNACALLMSQGKIQLVVTGADWIARNGDTANKIGTLGAAIIASYYNIPFYVAAPLSTFDGEISSGDQIPIEERSPDEVLEFAGRRIAPQGVSAYNFAFDVTPAKLIGAIITENGILNPPYEKSIPAALAQRRK